MLWVLRCTCCTTGIALLWAHAAFAQSRGTSSISGRVLSEAGRTLRANVTLSFASARGFPSPSRRVLTGADGSFSFSRLPAGRYVLCAQVADSGPAPANAPFVDTCAWGSGQAPVAVATGQQVAGIVFTAPQGAWLKIHVADPDRVLPQILSAKGPAVLEQEFQLTLKGPDGLFRHARFESADSGGRNYHVVIPLRTAVGLKINSTVAQVLDQGGKKLQDNDEIGVQSVTPSDLGPMNFTLHRKEH